MDSVAGECELVNILCQIVSMVGAGTGGCCPQLTKSVFENADRGRSRLLPSLDRRRRALVLQGSAGAPPYHGRHFQTGSYSPARDVSGVLRQTDRPSTASLSTGKALLAQSLKQDQRHTVGEVQRTGLRVEHRNPEPAVAVRCENRFRQACRFAAKH